MATKALATKNQDRITQDTPFFKDFKAKYPEFDWIQYSAGKLRRVKDTESFYYLPKGSQEPFFFTNDGTWYSNKRIARFHPCVSREWPSFTPSFKSGISQGRFYFKGRDLNVATGIVMRKGQPYKPDWEQMDLEHPYMLDKYGDIERITWLDVPGDVKLAGCSCKWIQSFRNKEGDERILETGLNKDGRTFVLVNEKVEAEMNEDKWWAENKNVLQLESRDGNIVPRNVDPSKVQPMKKYRKSSWFAKKVTVTGITEHMERITL